MAEIADCAKAIKNLGNVKGSKETKQLVHIIERSIHHKTSIAEKPTTTTFESTRSRVTLSTNRNNTHQTISITQPTQQLPTMSTPEVPREEQSTIAKHKHRKKRHTPMMNTTSPENNTRSRTQKAETPSASRTRTRTRVTMMENNKKKGQASRVETTISQLKNDAHQELAPMDTDNSKLLNYRQLMRNSKYKNSWSTSSTNEFRRLENGVGGRIKNPTNTITFIRKNGIPQNCRKEVTHGKFICSVRPEEKEKNRTSLTFGRDRIDYPGKVATPTADMLVAKILFNSVISTKGSRFMTIYIPNFYLMTPLKRTEYTRIHSRDTPDEIITEKNQIKNRRKRCGIYRCQPRHVCITTVRTPSQRTPWKMT